MTKNKKLRLTIRSMFVLATLFIVLASALPNLNDNDRELGMDFLIRIDYLFHFSVFFGWGLLLRLSLPAKWGKTLRHIITSITLALIFTYLSEYFQHYVPGRAYNPVDLGMNFGGFILALGIHRLFPRQWNSIYRLLTDNSENKPVD
jgi:VanZ family protein